MVKNSAARVFSRNILPDLSPPTRILNHKYVLMDSVAPFPGPSPQLNRVKQLEQDYILAFRLFSTRDWGLVLTKAVFIEAVTAAGPYFSSPFNLECLRATPWPSTPQNFTEWARFCRNILRPNHSSFASYIAAALIQRALRTWPVPQSPAALRAFKGLSRHVADEAEDSERMERELACAIMNPGLCRDRRVLHRRTGVEGLVVRLEFRKPTSSQIVARWCPDGSTEQLVETELFDLLPLTPGFGPKAALKVHPLTAKEIMDEVRTACPTIPTSFANDSPPPPRRFAPPKP